MIDFNIFTPRRPTNAWFSVGLASSYPDITTSDDMPVGSRRQCGGLALPGGKVFQVSQDNSSGVVELDLDESVADGMDNQVLIFQFRNKFYAIDHSCPHSSYPLSKGMVFDIEDFGVRLSAGIRCSKHDWFFDLIRGNGDRGNYRLKIWEVQMRSVQIPQEKLDGDGEKKEDHEIWVRRKQRIG